MFLFFFAKNAFFFAFFGQNHHTKLYDSKSHFWTGHRAQTSLSSSFARRPQTNPFFSTRKRTTFLRRRETTTQKKRPRARICVFVGSVSGEEERPVFFRFVLKTFVRFFPREREIDLEKDLIARRTTRRDDDDARGGEWECLARRRDEENGAREEKEKETPTVQRKRNARAEREWCKTFKN